MAQRPDKPELVTLSGQLQSIETHACPQTTGHGYWGTHLMMESDEGKPINLHLGPTAAIQSRIAGLEPGQALEASAFRTDRMPADHYVAKTLRWADREVALRDDALRPFWAGQGRARGWANDGSRKRPMPRGRRAMPPRAMHDRWGPGPGGPQRGWQRGGGQRANRADIAPLPRRRFSRPASQQQIQALQREVQALRQELAELRQALAEREQ
jgi:hypothetical protein